MHGGRIDPRTLDITDEFGGLIPYPGYGGDIALDDPVESVPVTETASTKAEAPAAPRPPIGLTPQQWRQQHGLEAPPEPLSIGMPDIGPREEDYPGGARRADLAAAELADNPGRFHETTPSVSMDDISLAGMAANAQADTLLQARHRQRMAAIDANERNPMKEELEARRLTASLEDEASLSRPLIGQRGAFSVDPRTGAYVTNAPAERLQDFRKREAANLNTILGSSVMRQLQDELGRIERGTSLDEEGNEAPLAQPMTEDQKEKARKDAFRIAAFALQNYAGGKDFSGFFRETYDPNDLRIGR